ncbi:MAG: hypothetical protein NVS4B12_26570 [Ktedonobacteraceae bacterium]
MSFTQDELQALNTILEQKLSGHRRELERTFDQRIQGLRRDFEQRLTTIQQDLLRNLSRTLGDQQTRSRDAVARKLDDQQMRITQSLLREIEQKRLQQQQHNEDFLERSLAAQLLAFEQIIGQRRSLAELGETSPYTNEPHPDFDTIEVQTEIPWDELVELIDRVLDERLATLQTSLQTSLKDIERYLAVQIHAMRASSLRDQKSVRDESSRTDLGSMQDVFRSIEQLERLIESMQVAMATNSALISDRLYYHQQQPIENAHPAQKTLPQEKTTYETNVPFTTPKREG